MTNLILAYAALLVGQAQPVSVDTVPVDALVAVVHKAMEDKFPESHTHQRIAVDARSFARVLGGSQPVAFGEFKQALGRPVETLGADPDSCRESKCWKSVAYIELMNLEKTTTGYEAVIYMRVRTGKGDYHVTTDLYSVSESGGSWSATLKKPLLRS